MSDTATLRAAVRLALQGEMAGPPPSGGGPSAPGLDAGEILEVLSSNKVPLVSLARQREGAGDPLWMALGSDPGFAAAQAKERARHSDLLRQYLPAARVLESAGIRPVLLKTPAWFPYLSSNLDVLVPPASFAESARILEELGHIRFPHYREDHKLLFRTFTRGEPSLSVHLHEAVSWGKVVIVEGKRVASRGGGGEDAGVLFAAPADALAATLAHTILETDQVRLSDLRTVRYCLGRGASAAALLGDAREHRWEASAASALALYDAVCRETGGFPLLPDVERHEVREALRTSPWAERLLETARPRAGATLPHALPRTFSKRHLARLILGDDRRDPERKFFDLAASGWSLAANRLGYRCRPARLITVSGPDGAGKSRLAADLEGTLRLCEVPTKRFWSRGGFSAIAVGGKALVRRVAPGAVPGAGDERGKRDFLRAGWRRALWMWMVAIEQVLLLQRLRVSLLLGRSVVCDRYVFDTLADLLARLPGQEGRLPARAAGFLLGAAPVPSIAFLIDVDPDVAHARKEDGTTVESRRDLARAYGTIREAAAWVRLDGELPFKEMAQRAIDVTLRRSFAAFEGKAT